VENNYDVIFYSNNLENPIIKFLDKCDDKLRSKVLRQIKYVNEFGLTAKVPNIKKVTGTSFWELRILGKDNIRIFCIGKEKVVFVLHIFVKKKQKTPRKEIAIALDRIKHLDL